MNSLKATCLLFILVLSGCRSDDLVPARLGPNVIVIFTDDQGFADLSIQGQRSDVKTPNIDSIAANGAQMTNGYVTAPQCTPSRAAMVTGQYQQRFGVDDNRFTPMPLDVTTLGQRFKSLGYATGMVGKWHLEVDGNSLEWFQQTFPGEDLEQFTKESVPLAVKKPYFPDARGYDDSYFGYQANYWATFNTDGTTRYAKDGVTPEASYTNNETYRVDAVSNAAVAFIERHKEEPFYLHVAHYAPHVPLEAPQKYLERFPAESNVRRHTALAMMSAVDDGVGRILDTLAANDLLDNTIVFFISDNGAPLGLDMRDAPLEDRTEAWNGSLNMPLVGEKGMLTDGGIRVPFLVQWPDQIPAGILLEQPVLSLDAAYTALKAAGATDANLQNLDGVDLLPALKGDNGYLAERPLFWRFWRQSAVRLGNWKYLEAGRERKFLFDMSQAGEAENVIASYPAIAADLEQQLETWLNELQRPMSNSDLSGEELGWYSYYLPD